MPLLLKVLILLTMLFMLRELASMLNMKDDMKSFASLKVPSHFVRTKLKLLPNM